MCIRDRQILIESYIFNKNLNIWRVTNKNLFFFMISTNLMDSSATSTLLLSKKKILFINVVSTTFNLKNFKEQKKNNMS